MNALKDKVVDFLLNKALGRIAVRLAASAAMYLASGQLGIAINVDPNVLAAKMITGINILITLLKPRDSNLPEVKLPEPKA